MTTERDQTALGHHRPDLREWRELDALGLLPEWQPVPGYSRYEASRNSLWRRGEGGRPVLVSGGYRNAKGVLLQPRLGNRGYLLINLVDDTGVKRTLTVQKGILLAHAGEPGPGEEALHENDDPYDNRFPVNLYYGTHPENEQQKIANGGYRPSFPRRAPKPRGWRKLTAWLRRAR